jgi:hypothetical protein
MTPLDKIEVLFRDLVYHYGEAKDGEIRAAVKLLMVSLSNLKRYAGSEWYGLAQEYVNIMRDDPAKFESMLAANRSRYDDQTLMIPVRGRGRFEA